MPVFEYKVVPAPRRGEKARGARTTAERFAEALSHVMNDLGRDGWEYLRADTLPCEERVGLTGKATAFQNMLVFRRAVAAEAAAPVTADPPLTAPPPPGPGLRLRRAGSDPAPNPPALGPARSGGDLAAE